MPVHADPSGRRWVAVEVEVPGTPDGAWRAIATGPGISSWFVPTTFEHDRHGNPTRVISNFGPGMESVAEITSNDPPRTFTATCGDLGPDAPEVLTEWRVEPRDGDRCLVRVMHAIETDSDKWDRQLEAWEAGWPDFFRLLRLYLTHFAGQPCAAFQVMGAAPEPKAAAWAALNAALGLPPLAVGDSAGTGNQAPDFAGLVERAGEGDYPEEMLLRLDRPGPGLAHLFALPMGGRVLLSLRIFIYGDQADAVVNTEESRWQTWFAERFPMKD